MLSREMLEKYSCVLSAITSSRGLPYRWDPVLSEMRLGDHCHLLAWMLVVLHSCSNFFFLLMRLLLNFSSMSTPFKVIHIVWLFASFLQVMLQLYILLHTEESLQFSNLLIKQSMASADKLRGNESSSEELTKQERLLEIILLVFAGLTSLAPAFAFGIFFIDPLQSQFVFFLLPESLQTHFGVLLLCGVYEATWITFFWATLIFFIILQVSSFFLLKILLEDYRTDISDGFGTHRWILEYRKMQLFLNRFNYSIGKHALPMIAFGFMTSSLITNYGSIRFFYIRRQLSLPFYLLFPLASVIILTFELVLYPWVASIHALSSSIPSRIFRRNHRDFSRQVLTAYARSLAPLQVKIGPVRRISKSTILAVLTFTIVSTTRLVILIPTLSA